MSRPIWMVLLSSGLRAGRVAIVASNPRLPVPTTPAIQFYKQAQQDLDNNNFPAAAEDFRSALRAQIRSFRAREITNWAYFTATRSAIRSPPSYHYYKKFLELVPTSDKTNQVNAAIQKQNTGLRTSTLLPNSSSGARILTAKLQGRKRHAARRRVADEAHTIAQLQKQLSKHHIALVATSRHGVGATSSQATPTTRGRSATRPPPRYRR